MNLSIHAPTSTLFICAQYDGAHNHKLVSPPLSTREGKTKIGAGPNTHICGA
jgi:hypothetical protein